MVTLLSTTSLYSQCADK